MLGLLKKIDGTDWLANAPNVRTKTWSAPSGALCPLMTGAALSDRADWVASTKYELEKTLFPMLLLPFIASVSVRTGQTFRISWAEATTILGPAEYAMEPAGVLKEQCTKVVCQPTTDRAPTAILRRAEIAADIWQGLDAFGHRTFAPSTAASRLSGAGAGVSDND